MKVCSRCKQQKPYKEFSKDRTSKSGKRSQCKNCEKVYRESYTKTAEYRLSKSRSRKTYRSSIKEWLVEYKKTLSCEVCGESRHYCLDFHHLNASTKSFNISRAYKNCSIDTIKDEIKKCIVVCANCHREIHWNDSNKYTLDMEILTVSEDYWDEQ